MARPLDLMDYRELQRECKAAGVSAKGCAALRPPSARCASRRAALALRCSKRVPQEA